MEHRPQTTRLHPALSYAAVSFFLQLNLKPAVHISLSRSLFHVFLGRPLTLWPCDVHCSTCLAMLSSLLLFPPTKPRIITLSPVGLSGRGTAITVSVCMSVCLSVCEPVRSHILQNCSSKFHEIFCTCYQLPWLSPPLTKTRYVMYFRFCDTFPPDYS